MFNVKNYLICNWNKIEKENKSRPKKDEGGNRRERKLKAEMKELRQDKARVRNELHCRKQQRKSTKNRETHQERTWNKNEWERSYIKNPKNS